MFKISRLIILIIFATLLSSCSATDEIDKGKAMIAEDLGVTLPEDVEVMMIDNKGFNGDGELLFTVLIGEENNDAFIKEINTLNTWQIYPLSDNLNLVMYGGTLGNTTYSYEFATELGIPKIENGYWIFKDRNNETVDFKDDSKLFTRPSFNFTLAMYDADNYVLYYFREDT
jgi:hypothetical protein